MWGIALTHSVLFMWGFSYISGAFLFRRGEDLFGEDFLPSYTPVASFIEELPLHPSSLV